VHRRLERALSAWIALVGTTHPLGLAGLTRSAALAPRLGVRAATIVTGVSAQGREASAEPADEIVRAPIDAATIAAQFRAVDEIAPGAFHVGAQVGAAAVRAVARELAARAAIPVVVDPVIATSGGRRLADDATVTALRALFALATVVTPNLAEAEHLLGVRVRDEAEMRAAGRALRMACGARAVLIKGGHLADPAAECFDVLVTADAERRFSGPRVAGTLRGTGDALATALAAHLARGASLEAAVEAARGFVAELIANA
jgi:hydroxymethylpyrimidine/phosphomethylpyrimidine kinase